MDFIFFISFCSNLSISSIDAITGFKNSSSISLLILTSLYFNSISFNSIKYFSNSKNYSLPLKSFSFPYCLSIFSQYFCFHNLNFPFLYIKENFGKILENKNIVFKTSQMIFLMISSVSQNTHTTYITHISRITYLQTHIIYITYITYKTPIIYITHIIYINHITYITRILYITHTTKLVKKQIKKQNKIFFIIVFFYI